MNTYKELLAAVKVAKRVYIIGNGGSAANALHIANDLILCGIRAQAIPADTATLTAIGNDYGFEHIFSSQINLLCDPEDLLIALSGSGNSPNIIKAIVAANKIGMRTFAIVGNFEKNAASVLATYCIQHGENMQDAENHHLTLIHQIYRELKGLK
jgi:D-sedoheptulose 7-phosphate isomerase